MRRGVRFAPLSADPTTSNASREASRAGQRIQRTVRSRSVRDVCATESCAPARSLAMRNRTAAAAPAPARHRSTEILHVSLFISAHQRAQAAPCAEQPRFDRGGAHSGYSREIAIAPIVRAHQQNKFALIDWQLGKRALHLSKPLILELARRWIHRVVTRLPRNKYSAPSATP